LRILVVDDNHDTAESMARLLQIAGNTVRMAHDGEAAVEAASEFLPQVVLLDIGLPKMDGYEAARRIRSAPSGESIVLIAVTGWGHEADVRKALEAGFDRHMVKPVDPRNLTTLLSSLPVSHRT
jgi:CheY-like chemotaxis protein